jgi:hypothetical protein
MKTPRDILLQHHRSAQPELDAIRRAALSGSEPTRPRATLRDVLRSFRWHLVGMSAVWLFVLLLHANSNRLPQMMASIPSAKIPPPHAIMVSLRENRRRLSEMMEAHPADSARHELYLLKPRTEWRGTTLTA